MNNTILFAATDPRGYSIICTQNGWLNHVLDGHSEMEGLEKAVKDVIEHPELGFIYQDKDYPERNVYYKFDPSIGFYIKVVVSFSEDNKGEVVTTFLASNKKPGEKWIWPPSRA